MNFFLNKKVGVLGLSRTGISSIKFLQKKGFNVFGWDDNKKILLKAKKNKLNIKILNSSNLKEMSFLLTSPGIPCSGKKKHVISQHVGACFDHKPHLFIQIEFGTILMEGSHMRNHSLIVPSLQNIDLYNF